MKKCSIDELPKYSKWPARLLGIENWDQKIKSKEEIDREYETESWGAYLKRIKKEGLENIINIKTLDSWQCDHKTPVIFSKKNMLYLDSFQKAYSEYLKIIKNHIMRFLPAAAIVELGSGYGSVILSLSNLKKFKDVEFIAGEYTPSGNKLIELCAQNQKNKIKIGHCDFMNKNITDFSIPNNSIIFTCISACTLPKLPHSFVSSIKKFNPKVVFHFEPMYDHHYKNTILEMLRKRYFEVNDYNKNLLQLLKKAESQKIIKILFEKPSVFGVNALFPISILAWK